MASPTLAANAYASIGRIMDAGVAAPAGRSSGAASGPSFGDMLKDAIGSVMDGGRQADQIGRAHV